MVNELQRQAYLKAIGVECYMPRLQLPGAKPSQLCVLPEVSQSVIPEPVPTEAAVAGATVTGSHIGAAAIAQIFGDEALDRRADKRSADTPPVDRVAQAIPRFALSIVRAGEILVIDNGLTGECDPQAYLRLIHNMLFALGIEPAPLYIEAFVWPMAKVRSAHVDQSETAARQTLNAYLSKQLERSAGRFLLLMGDAAANYVSDTQSAEIAVFAHSQLPAQCLMTRSAAAAMQNPLQKRDLWHDLQPLRQALKSS